MASRWRFCHFSGEKSTVAMKLEGNGRLRHYLQPGELWLVDSCYGQANFLLLFLDNWLVFFHSVPTKYAPLPERRLCELAGFCTFAAKKIHSGAHLFHLTRTELRVCSLLSGFVAGWGGAVSCLILGQAARIVRIRRSVVRTAWSNELGPLPVVFPSSHSTTCWPFGNLMNWGRYRNMVKWCRFRQTSLLLQHDVFFYSFVLTKE